MGGAWLERVGGARLERVGGSQLEGVPEGGLGEEGAGCVDGSGRAVETGQ